MISDVELDILFDKLYESANEEKIVEFLKLEDEAESVIFNTMLYCNLSSFKTICEMIYMTNRPIQERNKMQDMMNLVFNKLIPRVVAFYKEREHARKYT